jgi:hypothetical protein
MASLATLCVGFYVGIALNFGGAFVKPSLIAAVTIIGAALGGVPIAFLGSASAQWGYPVGLLVGLGVGLIPLSRNMIADRRKHKGKPEDRVLGVFAWFDLVGVVLAAVLAVVCAVYVDFQK